MTAVRCSPLSLCTSLLFVLVLLSGCQCNSCQLEPCISYTPPQRYVNSLPSAFDVLTEAETRTPWGQEYLIGQAFARELDLYRAITAYKRALILLPQQEMGRRLEITYHIVLAYYLGEKYQEVVETFECSELALAPASFPVFSDLLLILYDAYNRDCRYERAEAIFETLQRLCPEMAADLAFSQAVVDGEVAIAYEMAEQRCDSSALLPFLDAYYCEAKSPRTAQWLNGLLPGAGYAYVGQTKTAVTSLLWNALFITAAWQFFDHGYPAAGFITLSLEAGWYFGGINGGGLAAKEYNERRFECYGKEMLLANKLFPVLMLEFAF